MPGSKEDMAVRTPDRFRAGQSNLGWLHELGRREERPSGHRTVTLLDKIRGEEYTSYDKWTGVLVFMPAERRKDRQPSNLIWVMPA